MPRRTVIVVHLATILFTGSLIRAGLRVGTASCDITPADPVAVSGQFHLRVARTVESPVSANVLVLESQPKDGTPDLAIMVSCDLLYVPASVLAMVRERVHKRRPELDAMKIFMNGTHTHTAPVLQPGKYAIPQDGAIQVEQYCTLLTRRVAAAIEKAWKQRAPGTVSWGLSHAVVAYNRRTVYANGTAKMYGNMNTATLRGLEGPEDHDIGSLFAWDAGGKLVAIAVNAACPAQEVESRVAVNADFWHPVRESLQAQYGKQLCVLGWTGAAGDQSPHVRYRQPAETRMRNLRGLSRLDEIARRILRAVNDTYEVVKHDGRGNVALVHEVEKLNLPMRRVTQQEYKQAKAEVEKAAAQIAKDPKAADQVYRRMKWFEETVKRFKRQQAEPKPTYAMELHVLRIGDVVVCTNPFELYTEYGIRIKARSKAVQTFVIQLTGGGSYLATARAEQGGGYSAVVHSCLVGPEGGQIVVDRTVALIDALWMKTE